MLKTWIVSTGIILLVVGATTPYLLDADSESALQTIQMKLGEPAPTHYLQPTAEQIRIGEELVLYGRTTNAKGKRTSYISKYYACTSCHNLEQEDPDLRFSDPETRLPYVKAKGLPFLQGTTFKGIVNRETWYNDDYVRKYGDEKIEIAHENLRESIQLCAIECSQGRPMENWEVEAVLAYYWSLQFTLGDLGLSQDQITWLNDQARDPKQHSELRNWLRTFYLTKSPAHFYDAPPRKDLGYEDLIGNAARGKDLYELSCLHCHKSGGVSHYTLDDDVHSFRHLERMIPKDSHFSLYQIIAYGTYALPGHRPYMPHYPEERMSKQQVEDLRTYIELRAQ